MELLEQIFDIAFATPDGIQKLRELILKLAMQGKLVPQYPNDSRVSELLEIIETEKNRLVKERKIKMPKLLPELSVQDEYYPLPQGWQWVRLGRVGNIFNGNSINASDKESKFVGADGLPYIATKDVGYGFELLDYDNGIFIPLDERKFRIAHKGAVLICAEGGSAGKKCGLTDRDICFGNKLFANEPYGHISSKFILYVYLSPVFRASFSAAMTGIIGGVSIAKFVELPIPLPPIEEQKRIVDKLDKLMVLCNLIESLRKDIDKKRLDINAAALPELFVSAGDGVSDIARAFFTQCFEDIYSSKENVAELRKVILHLAIIGKLTRRCENDHPVNELIHRMKSEQSLFNADREVIEEMDLKELAYPLPEEWSILPLEAILVLGPINGYSPKSVDYETKVKSLTLSATTSGVFKGEHSKFIADDIPAHSDLWLQDGDILVQRGNSIEYVGIPAIYRGKRNTYIFPDLMMKLRVSSNLDSDYVCFAMSAPPSRNFLRQRASGRTGTMPKINQKTLKSLPIPIPPLEEQRRIVEKINKLMQLYDRVEKCIDETNRKHSELLNALIAQ